MLETPTDETAAQRRLEELRTLYGLPGESEMQDVFLQRVRVGELDLWMSGLVAKTKAGATVTGAAADALGFPIDRAFFELVERISIFVARASDEPLAVRDRSGAQTGERAVTRVFPKDTEPESQRLSLSNGVALHTAWPLACDAAQEELIERDRVLRSFAGEYAPALLPNIDSDLQHALRSDYDVSAYTFGPGGTELTHVATGVFLFPRRDTAPLVYGFGAGQSVGAALASAKREALQRLAFLWGEDLPSSAPVPAPTPDFHQEYYLYPAHHAILRDWLAGKRAFGSATKRGPTNTALDRTSRFVDLTVRDPKPILFVAKAVSGRAAALSFGVSPAACRAGLPPHPIA